jgi:hypothetical protein
MFQNIFAINFGEKMAFLLKTRLSYANIMIMTLVFEKNANFFAENWQKLQKLVIITSTPGSELSKFRLCNPFWSILVGNVDMS